MTALKAALTRIHYAGQILFFVNDLDSVDHCIDPGYIKLHNQSTFHQYKGDQVTAAEFHFDLLLYQARSLTHLTCTRHHPLTYYQGFLKLLLFRIMPFSAEDMKRLASQGEGVDIPRAELVEGFKE